MDIVSCDPDDNRELFDSVRAGRGHHGIITRATLRLVPAPDTVTWHKLHYDTVDQLAVDQQHLVTTGAFDYVEGQLKSATASVSPNWKQSPSPMSPPKRECRSSIRPPARQWARPSA